MNNSVARHAFVFLGLVVVSFGIYSNSFHAPFQFDSVKRIELNPHVRVTELSPDQLGEAAFNEDSATSRPVGNLTFALNYYFHQYNTAGYRVVNVIIHAINGSLLYLFLIATLNLLKARRPDFNTGASGIYIALFGTFLWLVSPLHIQSVTYVVQRLNSLAALFFMASMLLFIKGRQSAIRLRRAQSSRSQQSGDRERGWGGSPSTSLRANPSIPLRMKGRRKAAFAFYGLSGLSWLLALGCKQTAAMLPFFVFLYEWFFFQDVKREWLKRNLKYLAVIVVLFLLVVFAYLGFNPLEKLQAIRDFAGKEFTFAERVLTQPRVVIYYLGLLFYPHPSRLNLDYDFPLSLSLLDPITTILSLLVVALLIGLAFVMARGERLISFCILWYFGNLLIESSVIPLAVIFEHRTYVPAMLVWVATATAIFRAVRGQWLAVALLCVGVSVFGVWTYERNKVWMDPVTLWADTVAKSPAKARPYHNLGYAHEEDGQTKEAIALYREALRIKPDYAEAHFNLGNVLAKAGRTEKGIQHLTLAVQSRKNYREAHFNLGNVLVESGRVEEGIEHYFAAVKIKRNWAEAHNNLGNALRLQGRVKEAIEHLAAAVRLRPEYVEAYNNLGAALAQNGELDAAVSHYRKALIIRPEYAEARNNLGVALARQGRLDEAISQFTKALRIKPDYNDARKNLIRALRLKSESPR